MIKGKKKKFHPSSLYEKKKKEFKIKTPKSPTL